MGWAVNDFALECRPANSSMADGMTYWALASWANNDTGQAWPSVDAIAEKAHPVSRRAVQYALKAGVEQGFLRRLGVSAQRTVIYQFADYLGSEQHKEYLKYLKQKQAAGSRNGSDPARARKGVA